MLRELTAGDRSLEPLANLPALEEISLSNSWPVAEFARLSVLYPNAGCVWFAPYVKDTVKVAGLQRLRRRDDDIHHWRASAFLFKSPVGDWSKIAGYVEGFEALQNEFRQQYGTT